VGAGLLSVLFFPVTGLALLRGGERAEPPDGPAGERGAAPLSAM